MMGIEKVFIAILIMAAIIFFTRALPFIFFVKHDPPPVLRFLEKYIPPMVMVILVIYCLKDSMWTCSPYGIPEILSVVFVAVVHLLKRNPLISIFGGTALYMALVQTELIQKGLALITAAL